MRRKRLEILLRNLTISWFSGKLSCEKDWLKYASYYSGQPPWVNSFHSCSCCRLSLCNVPRSLQSLSEGFRQFARRRWPCCFLPFRYIRTNAPTPCAPLINIASIIFCSNPNYQHLGHDKYHIMYNFQRNLFINYLGRYSKIQRFVGFSKVVDPVLEKGIQFCWEAAIF